MAPAFLRRFLLPVAFVTPPRSVRRQMAERHLGDRDLPPELLDELAEDAALAPAQLGTARRLIDLHPEAPAEGTVRAGIAAVRTLLHGAPMPPRRTRATAFDVAFLNLAGGVAPSAIVQHFRALTVAQRQALFAREALGDENAPVPPELARHLAGLRGLTPGDFANLCRQRSLLGEALTAEKFLRRLAAECQLKERSTLIRISATRGIHPRTPFYKYEYDSSFKVLCFGLGPAGERIVRLASEKGYGNLRCATDDVSSIFQRETKTYDSIFGLRQDTQAISALLMIDARDSGSSTDSLFWAAQLAEHDVDLRVALLLNVDASPPSSLWRKAMQASLDGLIEVPCLDGGPSADGVVLNLLRSIPNLETGLIGHELLDVKKVLATASTACVAVVR